jgi:acetyltransferase
MARDVAAIMRPRTVAVLGASATRRAQGNHVIANLQRAGFPGTILPIHASAAEIEGLATVNAIAGLPRGVDTAVVAVAAPGVAAALADLDRAGVRSAVIFSNGFSAADAAACRAVMDATEMVVHGPNCMGLIDFAECMPLYPSTITSKVHAGTVALIAQSGSAAISLMNSSDFGLTSVVTMGSEWQVTAPDYLRFFAADPRTQVIGVVLESIRFPAEFAAAAATVRAAGKSMAVLKVGRSDVGSLAVQAHTGALISRADAYDHFFARAGVPVTRDYDELIATVHALAATPRRAAGGRIGIVGISGGETALACDLAADLGIHPATFAPATEVAIRAALPGAAGINPLDLGATVNHGPDQDRAAIDAILADPNVDTLVLVQDSQASLTPTMLNNYTPHIMEYGRLTERSAKPVVIVSPTAENTNPRIHEMMAPFQVPVLRGLRAGLIAARNLAPHAAAEPVRYPPHPQLEILRAELAGLSGPLSAALTRRLLAAYDIPIARSALVPDIEAAVAAASAIGFPMVAKIDSPDVPHRSDVGGVELAIADTAALRAALARILARVTAARPGARISGFELQQHLAGRVEAMAGFVAAPPFGAVLTLGTGGTMVELQADHGVDLCPMSTDQAAAMLTGTRLGALLGGYRALMPRTDLAPVARLAADLSRLAADLGDLITGCDLNPILIAPGTGETTVVDALLTM